MLAGFVGQPVHVVGAEVDAPLGRLMRQVLDSLGWVHCQPFGFDRVGQDARQHDTDPAPPRCYVHPPCRFDHPVIGRRGCLLLTGQPGGGQLADRRAAKCWRDIFALELRHFHRGRERLGITLGGEPALVGLPPIP